MGIIDIILGIVVILLIAYAIGEAVRPFKKSNNKSNHMGKQKVEIIIRVEKGKKHKKCRKPLPWRARLISFLFTHLKTKGDISMQTAKVDQVFLASWPAPSDKYGNPAKVQDGTIQFSSDFPEFVDIAAATPEEIAKYNETASDDAKIPESAFPYTAKVTTKSKVGSTMVRIKGDANLDPADTAVNNIEGVLTVEVLSGDATAFADAKVTAPVDNEATPE